MKCGSEELLQQIHSLMEKIWESEGMPSEWKTGLTILFNAVLEGIVREKGYNRTIVQSST